MQPPQGLVEKVRGPEEAEVDRRLAAEDRPPRRRARRSCSTGDDVDLDLLPIQRCWPGDAAPFITLPAVITQRPAQRAPATSACTGCRRSTARTTRDALADPQGRAHGLPRHRRPARGRRRARARPDHGLLRRARRCPKHIDELMLAGFLRGEPVELVQGARRSTSRCPRNAEIVLEGYVEQGDARRRGPVRRPHRLLHRRRAVPGLPRHRDDDAPRRDLPVDRRRQAAAGGRVARQGDRAHLPARRADERARDRRLRPAGRRRVPQLLHRLDPQGLSRATRRR